MRLKKFLSAILSFVMVFTLFGGMVTTSAATVKLDSELTAAKKLGFLSASQAKRINKTATQTEVTKMISTAVKKRYGKTGKFLADIHNWGLTGEAMAKMGVALSHHHYDPRDFCVLEGTDNEQDKDYLHSVKWEYTAKDTFDLHAYGDENIASLNDVRKTAEKYGVGFMVGEFGVFGNGFLSKYRYSDKTLSSYITSMTKVFEEEGLGWVWGSMDGQ